MSPEEREGAVLGPSSDQGAGITPPVMRLLPDALFANERRRPDAIAVRDDLRSWTYAELAREVRQIAKSFVAGGLEVGDRFAVWAPNKTHWIAVTLGGQLAGGVLVPLNTRYKAMEAVDILVRSRARFLFTVDNFLGVDYAATLTGYDLPDLQQLVRFPSDGNDPGDWRGFLDLADRVTDADLEERIAALSEDNLCDILFTSGTTGKPKGVMTTHGQNLAAYSAWSKVVGLDESDVYLIASPFFHAFGYKAGWLAALIGGAQILPHAVFDTGAILNRIQNEKITVLPGPPTIFQSLLNAPDLQSFDFSSLRKTITGAASVPESLVRDMKEILGFETVLTGYGLTEATGIVSLSRSSDSIETIANFSGKPIDGVEVRIADESGESVAFGQQGEIWVRGFNVMKGYLDDPEATSETIADDGWLKTGDIGFSTPDGYLKITDRKKDMFITGGFNCYPAEIEGILLGHEKIADVAVVGSDDERMGQVCHAHVVLKAGTSATEAEIISWAREMMANFKVPRRVMFHVTLPRNAGGKVQKFKLNSDGEM